MERANQVGLVLSVLVAIVWVLVGMADWPVWLGVVVSMLVGGYWAFGRDFLKQDS
jgi:O-antigen/teichoic acid export membrane protein